MNNEDTIKVPDVECLYCKSKGTCVTNPEYIENKDNIIVRAIVCLRCHKSWKDFYGADNDHSPVISIQRNPSTDKD